jgi:inner membrane protease subunit 1
MESVRQAGLQAVKFLQFMGLMHCIHDHGVDISTTVGKSMEPLFRSNGDVILFDRTARQRGFLRGDVVIAVSKIDEHTRICKRITGVCGDERPVRPGWPGLSREETALVPPGHVWLEGDNPENSHDSRHYGPVPIGLLEGTVFVRIWPWNRIGWISRGTGASA